MNGILPQLPPPPVTDAVDSSGGIPKVTLEMAALRRGGTRM